MASIKRREDVTFFNQLAVKHNVAVEVIVATKK